MDRYPERVTRPTLNTSPEKKETADPAVAHKPQFSAVPEKKEKKFTKQALVGVIGIVVVLGLLWWFFLRNVGIPAYVDTSKYQVVCLQSGECYFGKITSVSSDTVQIKNVFYVQKTTDTSATSKTTDSSDNNLQLIKLGNEVHGPEDMMAINRSQVLYIENLKSDGKVTQTINTYYQQNKN